ncbi:HAD family hydrolase [Nocardioides sp. HB32]
MDTGVRAILVDADGVLQVNADDWLDRLRGFVPAADGDAFLEDLFDAEQPALRGRLGFRDVVADVCARWGLRGREGDLVEHWRHAVVQPDVVALVRELRAAGVACHLATNQNDVRAAYLLDELGYADLFDSAFCSCDLGATKDEPAFLETVAERLALPPEALLLVDDSEKNLASARASGMRAVRWCADDDLAELRRSLAAEGIAAAG